MPRALWKGAITFGLVHVPVALYPASRSDTLDFDWLDKRDMAPIGYRRINKQTGKEVERDNIVRGLEYTQGRYVILSDEEIKAAKLKATQTVDIISFIDAGQIPPAYFDTPYFLAPVGRGEKVYSLLRETLIREKKIGIAYVVIQTKQHLAALIPTERGLILNTLRWATEIRGADDISLPEPGAKAAGIRPQEVEMAAQLVRDMSVKKWNPEDYHDTFRDDIMALVEEKAEKGHIEAVEQPEEEGERPTAKIIDLTALLKKSLEQRKQPAAPKRAVPKAASAGAKARGRAAPKSESKAAPRRKRA
jgi:DNA end-binding protein Ku